MPGRHRSLSHPNLQILISVHAPSINVVKRSASGKKAMLSCCKCTFACSKHACLTLLDREQCQEEVGEKAMRQN